MTVSVLAYIPSPSQGVWHLGPVPLRAYALCIIVGIIAALIIGDRRWTARGGQQGVIYDVALWAVPFGLLGGRLYHVMTDWKTYFGDDGAGFFAALRIWDGGLGIWGAVALGGVGAWIGCRQLGIPLPAFGDAIAPGIVLAQAIGRLGNYFNQELYGRPTTLPWGLEVYERRDATGALDSLNGVSTGQLVEVVHPTFLYELLWNVLVFALLIWVDRRFRIGHGRLFALYVAAYCVGRFWVELMRSDMATHIAGIRVNSFTSTFVFIAAVVYIMVAPKGREDPATLKGKDVDGEQDSPIDDLGEELAAVAATSGVVAAAKVAGDEDKPVAGPTSDGHAAVGSEAAAEAEDLTEQVATAPSEDIAEAEAFAAAGAAANAEPEAAEDAEALAEDVAAEAEDTAEPKAEPEVGLGSVEGDEAVEAEAAAAEVHEAAIDAAEDAEALAEDVAAEAGDTAEPKAEPEVGLGSVEGDEAVEAEAAAPEAHEAAIDAAEDAEALAEDVAAEAEDTAEPKAEVEAAEPEVADAEPEVMAEAQSEPEAEVVAGPEVETAAEAEPEAEVAAEAETAEPEVAEGESEADLGSVEGDEVAEAEAAATEVQAEPEPEPEPEAESESEAEPESTDAEAGDAPEPEDGLGSVEGDEVAKAQEDADEVHDESAEGSSQAEALAEDVAMEPETDAAEPATTAVPAEPASPRRRWWQRRR